MTTKEVIRIIDRSIEECKKCRVYFKANRAPIFGKFVNCSDSEYLSLKGIMRFVPDGYCERYDDSTEVMKEMWTKMFNVVTFSDVVIY